MRSYKKNKTKEDFISEVLNPPYPHIFTLVNCAFSNEYGGSHKFKVFLGYQKLRRLCLQIFPIPQTSFLVGIFCRFLQQDGSSFSLQVFKKIIKVDLLEPYCCKKRQKSPNQETGLANRGRLKVLKDTKLILNN